MRIETDPYYGDPDLFAYYGDATSFSRRNLISSSVKGGEKHDVLRLENGSGTSKTAYVRVHVYGEDRYDARYKVSFKSNG